MHTRASNFELVEPLTEPERTLNRRRRRRNRKVPFDQRNNPPKNPRIVYPPILNINHFRHFLDTLENLFLMDDEPMWAADRVVAPTPDSAITIPETANEFAIKCNHLTLVKGNQFDGKTKTDPHKHIHEFLRICNMFIYRDTENKVVHLMMFPLSLTGEAKTWLDELNEGTIETWDEIRTAFISRFFPPALFDRLLGEIQAFSQHENESLTDAWLRMKEMIRNCHGHNLSKGNIKKIFYHGLNEITQKVLNAAAGASIQNLETKFDRLANKQSGRQSGSLPSNTQPDLKGHNSKAYQPPQSRNEHVNAVFTRSGKSNDPLVYPNNQNDSETPINFDSDDEDEEPIPQPKTQTSKPIKETPLPKPYKPKIPYPQLLRKEKMEAQYGKFLDMIRDVRINVPLIDVLARMPNYGKFLKELITDLGASINLMPYSLYAKLSLENLKPTKMSVRLADRSFQYPVGIAKNMLVEVVNSELKTKQLNLGVGTEQMIFNIDSAMKHSYSNDDTCFSIDVIDEILEEDFDALLDECSKILHSIEGTLLEEEIFAEFDEFIAMTADENSDSESNTEDQPPNWNLPFELMCDASDFAVGAVLGQKDEFDIEIKDRKGVENVAADHLSHLENDEASDDSKVDDNFPGETLMEINTKNEPCGQVENTNKALKRILEKTVKDNPAIWSRKLDDALWAFRTAYKTPTGTTPYKLIYGKNCHLPFEIEHRAYWALKNCNPDLIAAGEKRMFQLHELDEFRHQAYENSRLYKERTKVWHDRKLRMRKDFKQGNKVVTIMSSSPHSTIVPSNSDINDAIPPPQVIIALLAVLPPSLVLSLSPMFDSRDFFPPEEIFPISSPDPITPPAILTLSLILPPSLLFNPRYFFIPEELLLPRKQIHSPYSSSTTLFNSSRNQTCNLVSPSSLVYTSIPPQVFEIGKCSDKMYLKHHEKQVEDILNYLDELYLHRIERMEEGRINGNELKTELKEICIKIVKLKKKRLGQKDKIAFAHYRISNLERIIEKIQARHQTNQEDL
ncbi:reverse transcriptase domain-containing protein [Tanacetum coccineum]